MDADQPADLDLQFSKEVIEFCKKIYTHCTYLVKYRLELAFNSKYTKILWVILVVKTPCLIAEYELYITYCYGKMF